MALIWILFFPVFINMIKLTILNKLCHMLVLIFFSKRVHFIFGLTDSVKYNFFCHNDEHLTEFSTYLSITTYIFQMVFTFTKK